MDQTVSLQQLKESADYWIKFRRELSAFDDLTRKSNWPTPTSLPCKTNSPGASRGGSHERARAS